MLKKYLETLIDALDYAICQCADSNGEIDHLNKMPITGARALCEELAAFRDCDNYRTILSDILELWDYAYSNLYQNGALDQLEEGSITQRMLHADVFYDIYGKMRKEAYAVPDFEAWLRQCELAAHGLPLSTYPDKAVQDFYDMLGDLWLDNERAGRNAPDGSYGG